MKLNADETDDKSGRRVRIEYSWKYNRKRLKGGIGYWLIENGWREE